jgi:hypothetical protein
VCFFTQLSIPKRTPLNPQSKVILAICVRHDNRTAGRSPDRIGSTPDRNDRLVRRNWSESSKIGYWRIGRFRTTGLGDLERSERTEAAPAVNGTGHHRLRDLNRQSGLKEPHHRENTTGKRSDRSSLLSVHIVHRSQIRDLTRYARSESRCSRSATARRYPAPESGPHGPSPELERSLRRVRR